MAKTNIEDVILFQIDRTSKISKIYSQKEFDRKGLGITIDQWVLLKIIEESHTISQRELADTAKRDPASITRTLDILERKGFVIREGVPENRRQYNLQLTPAGQAFVKKHMKMVKKHRKASVKGFTEAELEQLKHLLLRIQENMR